MAGRYSATYRSEPQNVATARHAVANFARSCGFAASEVMDIEIAAGEALANAIQHGQRREGGTFVIRCECFQDRLTIVIRDSGRGFRQTAPPAADAILGLPSRGFGITLMRTLMNEVTYSDNGSSVKLVRRRQSTEKDGNGHGR